MGSLKDVPGLNPHGRDSRPPRIEIPPRRFAQADIERYAKLTTDFNPIHSDPEFAATTAFGKPIVFGTLVVGDIWVRLEELFGPDVMAGASADMKFTSAVLVDTTVRFEGAAKELAAEPAQCGYEFIVRAETGEVAATVEVTFPASREVTP